MSRQLRLFDGDGTGDDSPVLSPGPVPLVWHVMPCEVEGFGGVTWPRGEIICTSKRRALNLAETLVTRFRYEVTVYEVNERNGEIVNTYEYNDYNFKHWNRTKLNIQRMATSREGGNIG